MSTPRTWTTRGTWSSSRSRTPAMPARPPASSRRAAAAVPAAVLAPSSSTSRAWPSRVSGRVPARVLGCATAKGWGGGRGGAAALLCAIRALPLRPLTPRLCALRHVRLTLSLIIAVRHCTAALYHATGRMGPPNPALRAKHVGLPPPPAPCMRGLVSLSLCHPPRLLLSPLAGALAGPARAPSALPGEQQCVDLDERCGQWAARGECDANPKYMIGAGAGQKAHCRRSCGLCQPGPQLLALLPALAADVEVRQRQRHASHRPAPQRPGGTALTTSTQRAGAAASPVRHPPPCRQACRHTVHA